MHCWPFFARMHLHYHARNELITMQRNELVTIEIELEDRKLCTIKCDHNLWVAFLINSCFHKILKIEAIYFQVSF